MGSNKVITMCHFNRPEYSRQVFESLRGCDGISDYLILPHVEPGNDEVRALVEGVDFAECIPTFNSEQFGVGLNTELALADGFRRSDFVIHLEDDVPLASDALQYFEWCQERFRDDLSVFSVTAYNRRMTPPPEADLHRVSRRNWFHPLACATWTNRWQLFRGRLHSTKKGWDSLLAWGFCAGDQPGALFEVYPELSRAQHIGVKSSLSELSPEWYVERHDARYWAGDIHVERGEFHS
jgi:hypothetical protein